MLRCSYCFEGEVLMEDLPTDCPSCGHLLKQAVRSVEVFKDDPEAMMAGLALEAEQALAHRIKNAQAQTADSCAMVAPTIDEEGNPISREAAEDRLRGVFGLDESMWELVDPWSEGHVEAVEKVKPEGVEVSICEDKPGVVHIKDHVGFSYKHFLYFRMVRD